jgi:threonine dehydrogenase-like Zn-dependent dehydrogenase
MVEVVLAAVRTAPSTTELRKLPMPELSDDAALLKVEVAGICGTDVKMYAKPPFDDPVIMGHENVGTIAAAGDKFKQLHGVSEGDRVFVEHYVGCYNCEWCRIGEYRHCEATDWRTNSDARRYGYTSSEKFGTLWGGFSEYMYLPWNAVLHKVPDGVSAELAGLVTPLSNGIEWALSAGKVGYASTVLIQGPGQQGLSQVVASKQAGASLVVVTGTTRDATRLGLVNKGYPRSWHVSRLAHRRFWSPEPRETKRALTLRSNSARTRSSTSSRSARRNRSWTSPAAEASTSCSTARRGPASGRCCWASTCSSAARARC